MRPGPLTRAAAEELLGATSGGGNLPSVLVQCPEDANLEFKQILGYLVQFRMGGFMVLLPYADGVQLMVESFEKEDMVDPLFHNCQVALGTARQRLGSVDALLVDLPWSMVGRFTPGSLPRSAGSRRTILHFTYEGTIGRPDSTDVSEVAAQWVSQAMDDETAQDYLTGNEMLTPEGQPPGLPLVDGHPDLGGEVSELDELRRRTAELERELASARKPPQGPMVPTSKAKSPGLFANTSGDGNLSKEQWAHLHVLAGSPPPRVAAAETRRPPPTATTTLGEGTFAEIEKEAVDPDVALPLDLTQPDGDPIQQLLMTQMAQNQLLLQKLLGNKHSDPVMASLAGDSGSASSSSGVKGCMAREAYLKVIQDLSKVSEVVQSNAASELGISTGKIDANLLKKYVERRIPLADHRLLSHVATGLAEGWAVGFETGNVALMGFCSKMMMFVEQVALDSGKLQLGWLLLGYPEPAAHLHFGLRKTPGLKPFSRLSHASWISANLAYLKDLDYLESRQQALGKQGKVPPDPGDREEDPKPKPKPRPRQKGKGKGSEGDSSAA